MFKAHALLLPIFLVKEIDEALKLDPGSTELTELKAELETLVDLLRKSLGQSSSSAPAAGPSTAASSSKPSASSSTSASFTTGTAVLARWRKDGKFYPARIASVSGSTSDPAYTVIFDIDRSTEVVRSGEIKVLTESKKRSFAAAHGGNDSDDAAAAAGAGVAGKGKGKAAANAAAKVEKKAVKEEERKARVAQQNKAQSTWQSFAKRGVKKGINIPGVSGESQFRSPDNPYGRGECNLSLIFALTSLTRFLPVGVVGSGKAMTNYEQKKRAKFEETGEE